MALCTEWLSSTSSTRNKSPASQAIFRFKLVLIDVHWFHPSAHWFWVWYSLGDWQFEIMSQQLANDSTDYIQHLLLWSLFCSKGGTPHLWSASRSTHSPSGNLVIVNLWKVRIKSHGGDHPPSPYKKYDLEIFKVFKMSKVLSLRGGLDTFLKIDIFSKLTKCLV